MYIQFKGTIIHYITYDITLYDVYVHKIERAGQREREKGRFFLATKITAKRKGK